MKKSVRSVLFILTVCAMMSVASVPAFASSKIPLATQAIATVRSGMAEVGTTINEVNSSTYIIIAVVIFAALICCGVLIGYTIRKRKTNKENKTKNNPPKS